MSIADQALSSLNVSRETSDRLRLLVSLLEKWNPKINLVSKSTLSDVWKRHILDSAQIFRLHTHENHSWIDIGSGGGFPGLVIAILAAGDGGSREVTLIESDQRKCAFLRTVLRETGVSAKVLSERIEQAEPQNADVMTARALADLPKLLAFASRHLNGDGFALFPKGVTWEKEIAAAQKLWSFDYDVTKSKTEPNSVILKVGKIHHV
nr:16S rRNA (guanine(527)-N(7))-methyltransferase RsmG [uncultured Shimia sp.]